MVSRARLVVTAVLVEGRSRSEVARAYGMSRRWVGELVARYQTDGKAGLQPRSVRSQLPSTHEQCGVDLLADRDGSERSHDDAPPSPGRQLLQGFVADTCSSAACVPALLARRRVTTGLRVSGIAAIGIATGRSQTGRRTVVGVSSRVGRNGFRSTPPQPHSSESIPRLDATLTAGLSFLETEPAPLRPAGRSETQMILGAVGAILVIAALVVAANRVGVGSDHAVARGILDARAVSGEIRPEQRQVMLDVLGERPRRLGDRWMPWLLAAVGVGLLVVPGVVAASRDSQARWANHWTVMADHMGWGGGSTTTTASVVPGAREITVEAGDLWFRPQTVELRAGETVNLTVSNAGRVFHDLTITDLAVRLDVEAGDTTTTAVSVDGPATYEFFCSVPGHAAGGMRGELIVNETDT